MTPLFPSFFVAGFECSSHRRWDGTRLDLLTSTHHAEMAYRDYRRCADIGIKGVRDGLRWHLIEQSAGRYDWSSWLPMVEAAEKAGVEVIWDIFHYGNPDFYDVRREDFPEVYAAYAHAAAETYLKETGRPITCCPLNEISFFAWAVDTGHFSAQLKSDRPGFVKRNLVRAAIRAAEEMEHVCPGRRYYWAEPLIHVAPYVPENAKQVKAARGATNSQYEALDLLRGFQEPELGGHLGMVDAVGLNYYPQNQWYKDGPTIPLGHHAYKPLSELLADAYKHYRKPMFISETGAEGSGRAAWLYYVCEQVRIAMREGVPILAICLYPITDYPGWENDRMASTGLFGPAEVDGERPVYLPLLEEMQRQQVLFDEFFAGEEAAELRRSAASA
jgi:beta-glucosidase/6-phospho-beta-glucosidase/beta-galactosidase